MIQDAGGVPLAGGARMRTGLVYRISGALAGPGELTEVESKGLRTIVDLRAEEEDRDEVVEWTAAHDVAYFNYPIVVGGWIGAHSELKQAIAAGGHVEYVHKLYTDLAIGFGDQIAAGLERISEGFPSGFGCAAGKDRTGVMGAYLQILLGASDETVVGAYVEKAPDPERLRPTVEAVFDLAPAAPIPEGIAYIMTVHGEHLIHALATVRAHGGVEAFLTEHGLSAGAIERLRDALIEPAADR